MENNTTNNQENFNKTYTPRSKKYKNKEKSRKNSKNILKLFRNIIIVIFLLLVSLFILEKAPNYKESDLSGTTNLIINNNNITTYLKKDLIIDDNYIYLSKQDIANFFDPYIYYNEDEQRIVITYDTKVTNMFIDNTLITINDTEKEIEKPAFIKDETIYIPFSELKSSFNMEISYFKDTNIITVDTLSKEQVKATSTKNQSVKSLKDTFSRTVTKLEKGEEFILIEKDEKGWAKIRTHNGIIGYINNKNIKDETVVREEVITEPQIEGNISMVWEDHYTIFVDEIDDDTKLEGVNVVSPTFFTLNKSGNGKITDKAGTIGKEYVKWAKENNYEVWGLVANDLLSIDTTSKILNSYKLRNTVINNILNLAEKYELDGINIDFEYMYANDKDMFTQFIIELYPRLKEKNLVLSVDVTAPDGGENWSMCFDRHDIANNCDYIVFMAYDQYGESNTNAGPTAALDWVKVNLNKFLKTEEIEPNKIILGIPFYTRIWTETSNNKYISDVVAMKYIETAIPNSELDKKVWDENKGQYYLEYSQNGKTKKIWIEDERSITEKLNLVVNNNLAGAAYWAKDRESDNIWDIIKETLKLN